jgi:cyclic pyranopterin phosphate synthase
LSRSRTLSIPKAPAERFRLSDGTVFGIVASVTAPFCAQCDRSRITADGTWFSCLYSERGVDLREPLRLGATDQELAELVASAWRRRDDRGAERRLATAGRGVLVAGGRGCGPIRSGKCIREEDDGR